MPTIKELGEKRAEIGIKILAFAEKANDESKEWTAEDEANYLAANKEYDAFTKRIEVLQRSDAVKRQLDEKITPPKLPSKLFTTDDDDEIVLKREGRDQRRSSAVVEDDISRCLRSWFLCGLGKEPDGDLLDACRRARVNPYHKELYIPLQRRSYHDIRREFRASTTAGAGGETIAPGFSNAWEFSLLAFGNVRLVATILRTETGADLTWPTTNDTGNEGELVAEAVAPNVQDIATGAVVFVDYKYSSKIVKVSSELIQDAAFDLASELGRMLGERIARITNRHFSVGTGTGQPSGIVTGASVGKTAASATAIVADEIIDLVHSIDPAYRNQPGAGFMMHDLIVAAVRKLKDTTNQYLWQPGLQAGQPERLFNYPININQHMASALTTGQKVMVFGALSKYYVRDIGGVRLFRLNELYAGNDQVGFVAFSRHDGRVLDAGTDPIKILQMA